MRSADHYIHPVASLVLGLVCRDLEIIEPEPAAIESLAAHHNDDRSLAFVAFLVHHGVGNPMLTGSVGLDVELRMAFGIGTDLPVACRFLFRLSILIVSDFVEDHLASALHRLAIRGARLKRGLDDFTHRVVTLVQPGIDLVGVAGRNDGSLTDDGAARFIHHLRGDLVAMIDVSMQRLGHCRVDLDLHGPVRADGHRAFLDHLGASGTEPSGRAAAPTIEARVPIVRLGQPAISGSVEPVPWPGRNPAILVTTATHRVFHLGVGDRSAEVILRFDAGFNAVTKGDRFGRRIHDDLVLWLFVFLDPEIQAPEVIRLALLAGCRIHHVLSNDLKLVAAQLGVFRQRPFETEVAVGVGLELLLEELLALGLAQAQEEFAASVAGHIVQVVAGLAHPGTDFHRLSRAIQGPVGHDISFGLIVGSGPQRLEGGSGEAQHGKTVGVGIGGRDQPLVALFERSAFRSRPTVGVALLCKLSRVGSIALLVAFPSLSVAEELQGCALNRPPGFGVRHKVVVVVIYRAIHNHGVCNPDENAAFLSAADLCIHQIHTGFIQGCLHFDSAVSMVLCRLECQVPRRRLRAKILVLVFSDQAMAELVEAGLTIVESLGIRFEVGLDVI